jgi:hypothetical protein
VQVSELERHAGVASRATPRRRGLQRLSKQARTERPRQVAEEEYRVGRQVQHRGALHLAPLSAIPPSAAGRPGMFAEDDGTPAEGVMLRRLRLPARRKGAGVRSRLELAPAAYCTSAVEAMECFLPGAGSAGFWAVLEPVFGAGAFDAGTGLKASSTGLKASSYATRVRHAAPWRAGGKAPASDQQAR